MNAVNKFAGSCCAFQGGMSNTPQLPKQAQAPATPFFGTQMYNNVADNIRPSNTGKLLNLLA